MSAWHWPQWAVAVFQAILIVAVAVPPHRNPDRVGYSLLIYIAFTWTLWMGGFWG